MYLITLKEKVAVVSGGQTFHGRVLVAESVEADGDGIAATVNGFISIVNDLVAYNVFRNGKTEQVGILGINIMGIQRDVDIKGVPQ